MNEVEVKQYVADCTASSVESTKEEPTESAKSVDASSSDNFVHCGDSKLFANNSWHENRLPSSWDRSVKTEEEVTNGTSQEDTVLKSDGDLQLDFFPQTLRDIKIDVDVLDPQLEKTKTTVQGAGKVRTGVRRRAAKRRKGRRKCSRATVGKCKRKKTGCQRQRGEKTHQCSICEKIFTTLGTLQEHTVVHTGIKRYACQLCGKTYAWHSALAVHRRSHTGEKRHRCDFCEKAFMQRCDLNKHLQTHTGEKPYRCGECGKSYARSTELTAHMRVHTGERPYTCSVCQKSFGRSAHLKTHMVVHTGDKHYVCQVCGKAFGWSSALRVHKRTHTGEKPYKCEVCGKGCATSCDLNKHLQTHTGVKPHRCAECGKSYARSTELTAHIQQHIGDKPFMCSVCGKEFARSAHLRIHSIVHLRAKTNKCRTCGKSFAYRNALYLHMRTHSSRQLNKCHCGKVFRFSCHLVRHQKARRCDQPQVSQMVPEYGGQHGDLDTDLASSEQSVSVSHGIQEFETDPSNDELPIQRYQPLQQITKRSKKPAVCLRWTDEELSTLKHEFSQHIEDKTFPGAAAIKDLFSRDSLLSRRTVPQVKAYIGYLHKK